MLYFAILILIYTLLLYSAVRKLQGVVISTIIILCCFYDYLFIELSYSFPLIVVNFFKPFQELILLLATIILISKKINNRSLTFSFNALERKILICVVIPIFFEIIISFSNGSGISDAITGIRYFLLPIIISYILFYNYPYSIKINVFSFILIIVIGYAIYQKYSFNGNLSELWMYNFNTNESGENLIEEGWFNYLKNDTLRCTSVFTTPIDFSIICSILSLIFFAEYINKRNFYYLIQFLIGLYGIYLSQTRIGYSILGIGILISIYALKSKKIKIYFCVGLPVLGIIITFLLLSLGIISDQSALGRVVQYIEFYSDFKLIGNGFNYNSLFNYDSFILCTFNVFGFWGLLYFIFYLYLLSSAIQKYNTKMTIFHAEDIYTISISSSMIYVFGFHHIAGSYSYWLSIMLLFNMIYRYKNVYNKAEQYSFGCLI